MKVVAAASSTAGHGKRNNNFKKPVIRESRFEGPEEKLKGYVRIRLLGLNGSRPGKR